MHPTQPARKISRFVVSKVAGPPAHSNATGNQQQSTDAAKTLPQQAEDLKILERQNVPPYTDDLHGKGFTTTQITRIKRKSSLN